MERDRELAIGDELLALVGAPPIAAGPPSVLPVDVYTDPVRHALELRAISSRPAAVVLSSEIAETDDFVTTRIGDVPVLVSRGQDGVARAMVNACAHRGATVEQRPSGSARIFSCGFHGWSYESDGSLRSVSESERFGSPTCERGLTPLACEERHGVVWVTADPAAAPLGVRAWLGDELDDLLAGLGMADMACHTSTEYDLACNWKMLTDGFLETYHLKYLHRDSIAPYFPSNLMAVREYGDHLGGALPKNRLIKQLTELPRDDWQVLEHLTMAFVLVPGTVIQWQAGHVELFSIRPDPADVTRTRCRLSLMVPVDRAHETDLWDRNWERVCATIPGEDFEAAVDVQRNIDAGVVTELQIGATEWALNAHLAAVDHLIACQRCV